MYKIWGLLATAACSGSLPLLSAVGMGLSLLFAAECRVQGSPFPQLWGRAGLHSTGLLPMQPPPAPSLLLRAPHATPHQVCNCLFTPLLVRYNIGLIREQKRALSLLGG